jgi:hypothetical protein
MCCHTFFCSHKFHNIVNYFIFEMLKKKIRANFQRIIELFTQKIDTKLSKISVWNPGSGKNLFRIPDPGIKKAPDPGSGSATLLTSCSYLLGQLPPTDMIKLFLPSGPAAVLVSPLEQQQLTGKQASVLNSSSSIVTLFRTANGFWDPF